MAKAHDRITKNLNFKMKTKNVKKKKKSFKILINTIIYK